MQGQVAYERGAMIPQSVIGLVFFLTLIAPGLAYELMHERRHPAVEESAFREASRVALMSVLFSGIAVAVVALLRVVEPSWVFDVGRYLREGKGYYGEHYAIIVFTVALEVAVALVLVWLSFALPALLSRVLPRALPIRLPAWLVARVPHGRMTSEDIWYVLFRRNEPLGKATWVSVRLTDGSRLAGYVVYYTSGAKPDDRELALARPTESGDLEISDSKLEPNPQPLERKWDYIVVRGNEIAYLKVRYLDR